MSCLFFSSRRRHTRLVSDWSSDVCSSDLNDLGVLTPQFVGNPNLGPEVSRGTELGFEASALNDRVGLDFTFYNQTTHDAKIGRASCRERVQISAVAV